MDKRQPEPSFKGKLWDLPEPGSSSKHPVDGILERRGYDRRFLAPDLVALVGEAKARINNLPAAGELLAQAILDKKKIAVYGDYDVDGASSAAIMLRYLENCGMSPILYVPDRMTEGYGLNVPAMHFLKERGAELLISVDCGIVSIEPVKVARELGMDVLVIDHHMADPAGLPDANLVVDPNTMIEEDSSRRDFGIVCAGGLAWLVCNSTNDALKLRGQTPPKIGMLLDLVALATVADVVPLTGINRAFVQYGMKVMREFSGPGRAWGGNPGLVALSELASVGNQEISAYHFGFVFGPRINAGGRIGNTSAGARLLSSNDPKVVAELAETLDTLNEERRQMCDEAIEQAMEKIEIHNYDDDPVIVVDGPWHPGIIGIVAGRIKERYDRPVFVLSNGFRLDAEDEDDTVDKGSGRSVSGYHMGEMIMAARNQGIALHGGGHAMAAGAAFSIDKIDEFRSFACDCAQDLGPRQARVDIALPMSHCTLCLTDDLKALEPYGQGNPGPRITVSGKLEAISVLKEKHFRMTVVDGKTELTCMLFNAVGDPLGEALRFNVGNKIDVMGVLKVNEFRGTKSVQMMVEDARLSVSPQLELKKTASIDVMSMEF